MFPHSRYFASIDAQLNDRQLKDSLTFFYFSFIDIVGFRVNEFERIEFFPSGRYLLMSNVSGNLLQNRCPLRRLKNTETWKTITKLYAVNHRGLAVWRNLRVLVTEGWRN